LPGCYYRGIYSEYRQKERYLSTDLKAGSIDGGCMRKFLIALVLAVGMSSLASARTLVVYFSWGGTTKSMAEMIAASTNADLFRIEPDEPYPTSYTPTTTVAKEELEKEIYHRIKGRIVDFDSYDTVFIGVPVWWHTVPMIVQGVLKDKQYNWKGRTVIPFCTYAATYRDETLAKIVELTPGAKHLAGYGTSSPVRKDVDAWLRKIGQIKW
jgi:flavodoxin